MWKPTAASLEGTKGVPRGSQGMGVVGNNCLDCVLLAICCMFNPPMTTDAQTPSSGPPYIRSPLQDSLFGPSPWKILATTYEQKDF